MSWRPAGDELETSWRPESKFSQKVQLKFNTKVAADAVMGLSKRVSLWSVEEVLEWVQDQHPALIDTLHKAILKHAISGRALLRLKDHHLELLGVEVEEQQQEILQDLLLLRVQEEINELDDICSECFSS